MNDKYWTRREVMLAAGAAGLLPVTLAAEERSMITRTIPSSGET